MFQNASKKRKRIYIGTVETVKRTRCGETASVKPVALKELISDPTGSPDTTDMDKADMPEKELDVQNVVEALKKALNKGSEQLIELESYYYGTKPPSDELVKNEFKVLDLNVKVCLVSLVHILF